VFLVKNGHKRKVGPDPKFGQIVPRRAIFGLFLIKSESISEHF